MKHKYILFIALLAAPLATLTAADASGDSDSKVEELLRKMTLEEKVYQLCAAYFGTGAEVFEKSGLITEARVSEQLGEHGIGSISAPSVHLDPAASVAAANQLQRYASTKTRLGIPLLINNEGLHGLVMKGATCYPQAIGLAATFNPDLIRHIGEAIGEEAASRGVSQLLSPVLDLGREPRHGRVEETYGEDPYLASQMGVAFIRGAQSKGVLCTAKHFVANFCGDGGREGANVPFSERALRETHLLPFEAAVREGGVLGIMCAYNAVDGIPCAINRWLLTDLLRGEWGFKGIVVADWSAVNHVHGKHRAAASKGEASRMCVTAGLDVDLPRVNYYKELIAEVQAGRLDEKIVDESVRRVLRLKYGLGLFKNPFVNAGDAVRLANSEPHRKLALEAARQSIVLLKNDQSVLLLSPQVKTIAVIGPNADVLQLGGYTAPEAEGITVLAGLKKCLADKVSIIYERGCGFNDSDTGGLEKAVAAARQADICILVMGGKNWTTGGETRERATLELMGQQEKLIAMIADTGKPVVVVLLDGRPVVMSSWIDKVAAVLMAWFPGQAGGEAVADVLTGVCNPSGHLPITFPMMTGQTPTTYDYHPYGRDGTYVEVADDKEASRYRPQFPFGFGLSYTTFRFSNLECTPAKTSASGIITVAVDVANTGKVRGETVVQLYLSRETSRITQPNKRLKRFSRISLQPGETRKATFTLESKDLQSLDEHLKPCVGPGKFLVKVGDHCLGGVDGTFEVVSP